jgi:uncharacterized membrane protein
MRLLRFRPAQLRIVIFLLALGLNFFRIDRTSLWNDEGFSFFVAQQGLAHTLRAIAEDTQPPLYYLTLSLWLHIGTSVFVIRALSATAMTLALLPLQAAAARLFNHRVALLAGFLFAIAPIDITWAQKARPYPLQALLVACAFWGFVRVWDARDQIIGTGIRDAFRQRSMRPAIIDLGWFAYAGGGALAMLAQAPAGFFLLGCNAAMAIAIVRDIRHNQIVLLNWIIAQIILVLIWALWLPAFLHQIATHLTAAQIASKHTIFLVSFDQVLGTLQNLFGIAGLWRLQPFFLPIYAVLACVAIVQIIRLRPRAWPLLAIIFVPILACLAGFFLVHPIFGYVIYTFVWLMVPYTILIAFGIVSLHPAFLKYPTFLPYPKLLHYGVFAIVLLGNLWGIKNVYQTDTPPLDRVAALIAANLAPDDGIVLSDTTSGRWGITYYLGAPYGRVPGLGLPDANGDGLIHSMAETKTLHRVWTVVLDGETPAVDLEAPGSSWKPTLKQQVGGFQITLFQ